MKIRGKCKRCGACCRVFGVVEVTEADKVPKKLTVPCELGYRRMKTKGFVCRCLKGDAECGIYVIRPIVCRRFRPGSVLCKMARRKAKKDFR
jgi:Fe-S-cluster containining protein